MNAIGLITKFATEAWDKVYKKESIASIFDGERDLMKFTGVKTVKIAKHSSDGLGFYQRANTPAQGPYAGFDAGTSQGYGYGYPTGDVNLTWEEFTIRIDRARQLRIELFDNEESGELAVTSALTDFSRTKVAPEVDSYCFSTIASYAATTVTGNFNLSPSGYTGMGYNAQGPLTALNNAYAAMEEEEVPEEDQVVLASVDFVNKLRQSGEVVKVLKQNEYKENVSFQVVEYMGREIIVVPGRRFRTDINLTANGYSWGANSKAIDFIVCAKSAVYHVVKYDKIRVFEPKMVQDFDGYKVNVRVYHDCFVPDNKRVAIYVHLPETDRPVSNNILFAYDATNRFLGNTILVPGDLLNDGLYVVPATSTYASATVPVGTALSDISDEVAVSMNSTLPAGVTGAATTGSDYWLVATRDGVVIAASQAKLHVNPTA